MGLGGWHDSVGLLCRPLLAFALIGLAAVLLYACAPWL